MITSLLERYSYLTEINLSVGKKSRNAYLKVWKFDILISGSNAHVVRYRLC